MSITPIEIASMTPKSVEASVTRQGQITKEAHNQASLTAQFNNQIKQNSMQPVRPNEAANPEFRYDAKDRGSGNSYYRQNEQKKKDEKQSDENKEKKIIIRGFDIRV